MPRHISGVFVRNDRVRTAHGTTARVATKDRKHSTRALLIAIGSADLVITSALSFPVGAEVSVSITLPGRYIEFEVLGKIEWENGATFGISLDYLSARQAYAITLARQLLRAPVTAAPGRAAQGKR
jgi:hypothetical protein